MTPKNQCLQIFSLVSPLPLFQEGLLQSPTLNVQASCKERKGNWKDKAKRNIIRSLFLLRSGKTGMFWKRPSTQKQGSPLKFIKILKQFLKTFRHYYCQHFFKFEWGQLFPLCTFLLNQNFMVILYALSF